MKKSWFKLALTHRAIPCVETYVGGVGGSLHVEVFRCAGQIAERGERPILFLQRHDGAPGNLSDLYFQNVLDDSLWKSYKSEVPQKDSLVV